MTKLGDQVSADLRRVGGNLVKDSKKKVTNGISSGLLSLGKALKIKETKN